MKKFKHFKQSYAAVLEATVQSLQDNSWTGGTKKKLAYQAGIGEVYEWSNNLLSSAWIYKEDFKY